MIADNPPDVVVKLERKRWRAALITDQETGEQDFFRFQAQLIRKFGNAAGVYGRQLVFWDGKGMDPEGWVYKSEDEMEAETGLSRRSQREARKVLTACEVLEEKRQGIPCRLFYRVNLEKLAEILETPGSTLNQWKLGTKKDPETGKYYRPEPPTLNHDSREDGITDLTREDGNRDLTREDGITDPAREDGITDLASRDGITDPAREDGITDRAITESTSGDNVRRATSKNSSENSSRESTFQVAAGAQNRAAPPPQINKSSQSTEEEDSTTSFPHQPDVDPKMANEVRQLMENGRHAPVALKHYRAGSIKVEEVAFSVSWDATGSDKLATTLLPAVRLVLEESVGVAS